MMGIGLIVKCYVGMERSDCAGRVVMGLCCMTGGVSDLKVYGIFARHGWCPPGTSKGFFGVRPSAACQTLARLALKFYPLPAPYRPQVQGWTGKPLSNGCNGGMTTGETAQGTKGGAETLSGVNRLAKSTDAPPLLADALNSQGLSMVRSVFTVRPARVKAPANRSDERTAPGGGRSI